MNPETVREDLRRFLDAADRGTAAALAERADVSAATLSMFKNGKYPGDNETIARRVGVVLKEQTLLTAIGTGNYRPCWLVNTPKGLRIVKTPETVERIKTKYPEAYVVQIWVGKRPHELIFREGTDETA